MTRNAFVFCVGYNGGTAIVDRKLESRFNRLGTRELFAQGLFKPALASALFANSDEDILWLKGEYEKKTGTVLRDVDAFQRTLGVGEVFKNIQRTSFL
ncbi:MAG: hypothetical protein WCG80_10830 [Spirochaetales bacterium]